MARNENSLIGKLLRRNREQKEPLDFNPYPPRTLLVGKDAGTSDYVHLYTDNDGEVKAVYFGQHGLIHSHDGKHVQDSFRVEEHIPRVVKSALSDDAFLYEVVNRNMVLRTDDGLSDKVFTADDYKQATEQLVDKTIAGPVLSPVFDYKFDIAGETLITDEPVKVDGQVLPWNLMDFARRNIAAEIYAKFIKASGDEDEQTTDSLPSRKDFEVDERITSMISFYIDHVTTSITDPVAEAKTYERLKKMAIDQAEIYVHELKQYFVNVKRPAP